MNYLLLTLGHGSSAIFVDNSGEKQQIIGYEQERLSGIKSDSQFPIDAINEIEHHIGFNAMKGCKIFISHWFNNHMCNTSQSFLIPNKYITENDIQKLQSYNAESIHVTDLGFTHHDAHAYSAYAFYDYHNHSKFKDTRHAHCIVADGFGTNEEVLSIYHRVGKSEPKLIHRIYGYHASLGLMYQYATSFVGMKENQDEYKFLGYEAHIDEICMYSDIEYLRTQIEVMTEYFIQNIDECTVQTKILERDNIIDFESLRKTKSYWYEVFDEILEPLGFSATSFEARCAIAYFIQQTIECVIKYLIKKFDMHSVCVVGGCFYNVKLNNVILTSIDGDFCAMPLAGDQGAAIGMYAYWADNDKNYKPFDFSTLCWGKRRLYNASKLLSCIDDVLILSEDSMKKECTISTIAHAIADGRIVNVVKGNMEFGPRALCNTSTLMLPTIKNVAANNKMNNRNEVMPCAPVCTSFNATELFDRDELSRVIGSDNYMICTHIYKKPYSTQYGGVMHKNTEKLEYTGRPQIISQLSDEFMYKLLCEVEKICDAKCLVNTSFNAHGNPIVFDTMDIIRNYKYQREHADENNKPLLVVVL